MAKFEIVDSEKSIAFLTFEKYKELKISDIELNGYIKYGAKNDYPQYLLNLYNDQAEHGAIVGSKAAYLWGKGLKAKDPAQDAAAKAFLLRANGKESWNKVGKKISLDCEIINGFYVQVITNFKGMPVGYHHLQMANCRLSKCGNFLSYSEDWEKLYRYPIRTLPVYKPGQVGSFFLQFKFYTPTKNRISSLYPEAPYKNCIIDISSDTEISSFNYNYIANGFSAGTLVTFFNGEPTPEQKKRIKERLLNTVSGPEKAGSIVINYAEKDGKAAEITALNVDDLDKKFEFISKRLQQKIITGHRVTNPELFGIRTEGQLGNRVSLMESYELFLNTYSKPRQAELCEFMTELCYYQTGQWIEFEVEQLDPIGLDLLNDQDLTQDERRKLKGYEPLVAPKLDANGKPVPIQQQQEVNSNLKSLSGKENQNLMRIMRNYGNGKITQEQAVLMLTSGYGMSEQEAKTMLGIEDEDRVQFADQRMDSVLVALEAVAQNDDEEDEVIFEEVVNFKTSADALKHELSMQKLYMADALSVSVQDLQSGILNALKGNPTSTIAQIAKTLGIGADRVQVGIDGLLKKNLVNPNADGFDPTDKAYDKATSPLSISEVYTVYKYALKDDAPDLVKGGSMRKFCARLMALSKAGKHWTFEAIDNMNNNMGLNVWDYRGGFYHNPETKETEPSCRHIWKAITKVRRKKS